MGLIVIYCGASSKMSKTFNNGRNLKEKSNSEREKNRGRIRETSGHAKILKSQ
jgi:hypothetical protein